MNLSSSNVVTLFDWNQIANAIDPGTQLNSVSSDQIVFNSPTYGKIELTVDDPETLLLCAERIPALSSTFKTGMFEIGCFRYRLGIKVRSQSEPISNEVLANRIESALAGQSQND